ncbi:hypothetical protein LIR51_26860 [Blautia producta]|uniref:hypothetical protein n=1 Tax=Blautia TaxID=572511 RepID=UPI001D0458EE|nr:hypothetical protein [Blautia producta]MCB5878433.1 hypothetical protein [Blautia producta]
MEIYLAAPAVTTLQGIKNNGIALHRDLKLNVVTILKEIPEIIEHVREIPGRNEPLDYTEFTGRPSFNRGTLTITADVLEGGPEYIDGEIVRRLHGKRFNIVLDEDEKHYYTGRCSVSPTKDNDVVTGYTIRIQHNPFRTILPTFAEQFTDISTGLTSETSYYLVDIYIGEYAGDIRFDATFITPEPNSSTRATLIFRQGTTRKTYYAHEFPFIISDMPFTGNVKLNLANVATFSIGLDNKEL